MSENKLPPYSDEEYKYMDYMVNITFVNLASLSKNFNGIKLFGFDYSNKDHLFLLNVAYIYRRITGKNICISGHYFKTLKWNFIHRKKESRIYSLIRKNHNYKNIDVNEILSFMQPVLDENLKGITYGDIYDEYYKGA